MPQGQKKKKGQDIPFPLPSYWALQPSSAGVGSKVFCSPHPLVPQVTFLGRQGERKTPSPSLPSSIQDHSCRGTAEAIQAARRGHRCPSVPLGWLCQCEPRCCCPDGTAGRHPSAPQPAPPHRPPAPRFQAPQSCSSNPPGPPQPTAQEPVHSALRNATFKDDFRPPQRTVKKLASAYMTVAKLSLNQRQRPKIFLQAKSLLFSKSFCKDKKLRLLNLIHTDDHYICLHKDHICSSAYI